MDTFMSSAKPPLDGLRIERSAEQKPQSKMGLAVAAAAILMVTGAALWWHSGSDAVAVRTAVARDAAGGNGERTVLNASGYVTARREATVSSKVTGKVTEVLIEEGMKVKDGQVVARLDDSNVKASLDVAQAQLASAQGRAGGNRGATQGRGPGISTHDRAGQTTHRVAIRPGPGRVECQSVAGAPGAAETRRRRRGTPGGRCGSSRWTTWSSARRLTA